jgi:hypothetical protein
MVMGGMGANRVIVFLLLGGCTALCQQRNARPGKVTALPDAPPAQASSSIKALAAFYDTVRLPVDSVRSAEPGLRFDPGRFGDVEQPTRSGNAATPTLLPLRPTGAYHASDSGSFLSRATEAASSFVITRNADGKRRINAPYLFTVLTSAVAHSAYRPYWRRSPTQPFSDFGSTVGSDAGMNVFHEFEPGIMHLMKSHEPKFVSKIAEPDRR